MARTYLGDAVYIEPHAFAGCYKLVTSDGMRDTNEIVLEPEVVQAFLLFVLNPKAVAALRKLDRDEARHAMSGGAGDYSRD